MHILSPVTENCSSWISGRERMAVELFSWPSLHERITGRGDRTRGRLHAKRIRFWSSYRVRLEVCQTNALLCICFNSYNYDKRLCEKLYLLLMPVFICIIFAPRSTQTLKQYQDNLWYSQENADIKGRRSVVCLFACLRFMWAPFS